MKKNLVTVGVVAVILGGLIALNNNQPDRVTEDRMKESEKAAKIVEQANELEAQYAQNADEGAPAADAQPSASSDSTEGDAPPEIPEIPMPENAQRYLFETTEGFWILDVFPEWAPIGVARFEEAVAAGVYNDVGIFRVIPGFVIQFGIPADPAQAELWRDRRIQDDTVRKPNEKGTITFATSGPNSRTTQVFISLGDNRRLDGMGFAPFGKVVHGMDVVERINAEYRESPQQDLVQTQGSAYLRSSFPRLDFIKRVSKIADTTAQ